MTPLAVVLVIWLTISHHSGVKAFSLTGTHDATRMSHLGVRIRPTLMLYDNGGESTTDTEETLVVRPDPSILIAAKDDSSQRLAVGIISLSLAIGTVLVVSALEFLHHALPSGWFELWRDFTWPIPMGLIFLAAGIGHFVVKDSFAAMVPPPGTWGNLWQVPAPGADKLGLSYEDYHTYWSGIAEIGGGAMLIAGGLGALPVQIPAFLLFLLVASVTPANIYMATHDIQPPNMPPIPYPNGHYFRGALQCVLLGFFWELAVQ